MLSRCAPAGLICSAVALLEMFQHWRLRPLRAGMFTALGLWGIVPLLHGWRLNVGVPQVLRAMQLDFLMGALYVVRLDMYLSPSRFLPLV